MENADLQMNFESTVAVASDSTGKLLFYTNGCEIRGADGALLENGEGLNPGQLHDWTCSVGYSVPRGMMALPIPNNPTKWILIHTGGKYDPVRKLIYGPFYFTEIDMAMNGGHGAVVSKNNLLADGELEPFAVVRHGNGRDWWVVVPEYGTNNYQVRRFGPNGLSLPILQSIGPDIACRRVGSTVFSPDGSKYARTNNCRAVVLDFDRCTGTFSNPIVLERPSETLGGGGLAFSMNNRWLYASSSLSLFRADLSSNAPFLDSLFKQPYFEGESEYISGTSLAYMQYAPDGKIYISSQHREQFFSAMQLDADTFIYQPAALVSPVGIIRTLPHFPNFKLYDFSNSLCDTLGIDVAVDEEIKTRHVLQIYPNPATHSVNLVFDSESGFSGWLRLFDIHGKTLKEEAVEFKKGRNILQMDDLESLPNGIFSISIAGGGTMLVTRLVIN